MAPNAGLTEKENPVSIVRAKEPFSYVDVNGVPVNVSPGDLFDSTNPDVKKRAHLFEAVEVTAERRKRRASGVEDATAEPGAKRKLSTSSGPRGGKTQGEKQHDREAARTPAEQKSNEAKLPTPEDLGHQV